MDDGINGWSIEDEAADNVFPESTDSPIEEEPPIPTDEPEEITPEEATATTIPLPSDSPIDEDPGHLTSLVCDSCLELNLTHKSSIECAGCGKSFCLHYASNIDVQYCVNCMSDVSVSKSVITKSYEHRNEETGQLSYYRRRAREIKIDGLDWLFAQRKIPELSDAELDLTIEYHRNILQLMIAEQEKKHAAYLHRNAGVKVHFASTPAAGVTSTTTTTVKKTRTVSKQKATEQLNALLKDLLAKGLKPEDIAKMVGKK
jgi:hypothetical protein